MMIVKRLWIRLLQWLALYAPGAMSLRVWLHRMRGVRIGDDVFIGTAALIETEMPHRVSIGNDVIIGIRAIIIAHGLHDAFQGTEDADDLPTVRIEDDVYIGPGVIILENVTIGQGSVVTAGSVVTRSVPPRTMVRGNPAVPVASCASPLRHKTPLVEFYRDLKPYPRS